MNVKIFLDLHEISYSCYTKDFKLPGDSINITRFFFLVIKIYLHGQLTAAKQQQHCCRGGGVGGSGGGV